MLIKAGQTQKMSKRICASTLYHFQQNNVKLIVLIWILFVSSYKYILIYRCVMFIEIQNLDYFIHIWNVLKSYNKNSGSIRIVFL